MNTQEEIRQMQEAHLRRMLEGVKAQIRQTLADDEMFELTAKAARKSFDAFRAAGFTDEQAMQLITNGIGKVRISQQD